MVQDREDRFQVGGLTVKSIAQVEKFFNEIVGRPVFIGAPVQQVYAVYQNTEKRWLRGQSAGHVF
jgi:hypothetical protein